MKFLTQNLIIAAIMGLLLSACGTQTDSTIQQIPEGTYAEYGERQRQIEQDSVIFEGLAGVYFQRVFTFRPDQTVEVQILSDYPPEEGTATGHFAIENEKLVIDFESSNTPYYEAGTSAEFDNFQIVDSSFSTKFATGNNAPTFTGPGLILSSYSDDGQVEILNYFTLSSDDTD